MTKTCPADERRPGLPVVAVLRPVKFGDLVEELFSLLRRDIKRTGILQRPALA
jgi:hypothetical protein